MKGDPAGRQGGLASKSFVALVVTQFLGAMNDNMLRWLVVPIGKELVGEDNEAIALAGGLACFVLPYILLAAPAGYLADRFSKTSVIISCKFAEIVIMLLAIGAILLGNLYALFVVVFLMGAQSALFGPSKLGAIPEILRSGKISSGNGIIGLTTVIAVVTGTILGNILYGLTTPKGQTDIWISFLALTGVALAGFLSSLFVRSGPAADPNRNFPYNPFSQTVRDLAILGKSRPLLRVALGVAFFWSLASLAQLNVDLFAIKDLNLQQEKVGPLLGVLSLGVGIGSVLAGLWSGGKVELGLVPLGALGIAISSMLLFTVPGPTEASNAAYIWTCVWLFCLGSSAGLFDVPLAAYMQHRSPPQHRGAVLASSNFLTFSGMLAVSVLFYLMRQQFDLSSRGIFLCSGLLTLAVAAYAFLVLPQATLRFVVWLATHTIYRVRVFQQSNLPERGGALLVPNHVSWLDAVFLIVTSSRPVRVLVDADLINLGWWSRWLARILRAIPIKSTPKAMTAAIDTAREAIRNGELVCIFPEGKISATGTLQNFKPGMLAIIRGTSAPIVPVYLDELWGSIFSFHRGRFFWKWPRTLPYPVSIWFGEPVTEPSEVQTIRQAVQDLGAQAVEDRAKRTVLLPSRFLRMCRKKMFRAKVADSSGASLSGAMLLMRTLILRRLLAREVLGSDEKYVGILIPPSIGGVVVNVALTLMQRVTANLNYTVSSDTMNECITQANIKHVLTSRKVMEKLDLTIDAELVYLDDFKDKVTLADKLIAALQTFCLPAFLLSRILGLHKVAGSDELTVIFTSGSTGQPKGVMLSHCNILSNVQAIDQVVHLRHDDVLTGVLPFFHSFGFTVTLWTVLGLNIKGTYHFSPLDAKQVGKLVHKHQGTVLLGTPTFVRSYMRRCSEQELASLEVVVVGAEKMPIELAEAFEKKFGIRPVEGYGATELSPLASVNIPPSRSLSSQIDLKEGTVGQPVPGVSAKIVDPETFADLPLGESGMLLIRGANVMLGYLNMPEKTAEVLRDGWYVTGDIALIDEDGFIKITGRQSRFSKIGGEMVPHIRIEEALRSLLPATEDEVQFVVTAVPDERKGERLVVLYTELDLSPAEVNEKLSQAGLPNLWIPGTDSYKQVESIPVLGTGKLDLRGVKQLAEQLCSQA